MPITESFPVLAVIGPSASGKSSAVRALAARGLVRVHPTWTTRPRREDERDGTIEHRFVDDATFDRLQADGFFVDAVPMFGLPHRYGLAHIVPASDGAIDAVMLRAPLVARFATLVTTPLVYQVEDARADARLRPRRTGAADLTARLADNRTEREAGRKLADRVFVNDGALGALVDEMAVALVADLSVRAA